MKTKVNTTPVKRGRGRPRKTPVVAPTVRKVRETVTTKNYRKPATREVTMNKLYWHMRYIERLLLAKKK